MNEGFFNFQSAIKFCLFSVLLTTVYSVAALNRNQAAVPTPNIKTSPSEPPSQYVQIDISGYPAESLAEYSARAYEEGDYPQAAQYRYWAIKNGDKGFYDLAYYYALAGKVDDAIYWLIIDAKEGSPDLNWVENDKDMAAVRADPRWPDLKRYLQSVSDYWRQSDHTAVAVYLPDGYVPYEAIPVLVGLHGKGDTPLDFVDSRYQSLANDLHIAVVGLSGIMPLGKNAFAWMPEAQLNREHVNKLLDKVLTENKIQLKYAALFGFSQGAQVSLQLASYAPDKWRGAFAMSPGLYPVTTLEVPEPKNNLGKQVYFVSTGSDEREYNLELAKNNIAVIESMQGKVEHRVYPDQGHQFPADYNVVFPQWVRKVFKLSSIK